MSRPHSIFRHGLWIACLLALRFAAAAEARTGSGFTDLGAPITARTFQAAGFTRDREGRILLCATVRSQPSAKLLVVDAATGAVRTVHPLPGAHGAWAAVTASDGSVYIGTEAHGKLFRYVPADGVLHDLGVALAGETYLWDLAAGADGEVFGGTYPGCRVFRYAPRDGFSAPAPGPLAPGATYARAVVFEPRTRTLYAGTGVNTPGLVAVAIASGRTRAVPLPEHFAREQSVYQLFRGGDLLFAMIYPRQRTLVLKAATHEVVGEFDTSGHYDFVSPPSPADGRIYFLHAGQLKVFDPKQPAAAPAAVLAVASAQAMTWLEDAAPDLLIFTHEGRLVRYNPATGTATTVDVASPEEPAIIQSLATGPDGRIWIGGYLSGGAAAFDPATGEARQFKGISQSEQIAHLNGTIYFGLYPRARLHAFDPAAPWTAPAGNPQLIATLRDQSRPVAMLGVPELGKLFVGTIPEYGRIGGMLAVWDAAARTLATFDDVMPRQSIASLAFAEGTVIGGTTVQGGLGVEPVETEGRLFLWDPREGRKLFETVPVAGRRIVSGLLPRPDGTVWGFAEGAFFVFDLKSRAVTHRDTSFRPDFTGRALWQDATLVAHPGGDVFAVEHDRFLRIDGRTRAITVLRTGLEHKHTRPITMDRTGRIHFGDGHRLWRYAP